MAKLVKVGVTPGRIQELAVEDGMTIGEVLEIAELSADGYEIKADGETVGMEADASKFNIILLVKKIKGNAHVIKVGVTPGRIQEIAVESEMTVGEILEVAELDPEGYDIKADGNTVSTDDIVNGYSLVLLVKRIKGNR